MEEGSMNSASPRKSIEDEAKEDGQIRRLRTRDDERMERMEAQLRLSKRGIINLVDLLKTTEIIVVADDSGSMNQFADSRATNAETRWHELRSNLNRLLKLLIIAGHSNGFRLKFLNDDQWYTIRRRPELDKVFATKPKAYGKSPLKATLEPLLQSDQPADLSNPNQAIPSKDTVIVVLTDGEPSDASFEELAQTVHNKTTSIYVSFVMTTDEQYVVDRYKALCDGIPNCEITNDFYSELQQARRFDNDLTHHQWLARILLVKYDQRDYARLRPSDSKAITTFNSLSIRLSSSSHQRCCILQ